MRIQKRVSGELIRQIKIKINVLGLCAFNFVLIMSPLNSYKGQYEMFQTEKKLFLFIV